MPNADELLYAIADADPGDDIVLADGDYLITRKLRVAIAGTADKPITVRAAHKLAAHLRSQVVIAFEVTAPYWHFSGLDIAGVCAKDTDCEHAFHVVGHADGFRLSDSRLWDFNAHLKVNSNAEHELPANGLVENNEFFDTHPRHTNNPVAPVNIDNAITWVVRGNLIHDFQKDGAGEGSYGAFVKGGSQAPVLERNLIECASRHPSVGLMVGLSFGAHGMDAKLCPPRWDAATPCDPEVSGGIIRNNIVRNCSDDGIYLNKATDSKILFNTLVNTAGIEFRFPSSSGTARGNLLMGPIRATQGAHFTDGGNVRQVANEQLVDNWTGQPLPGPNPLVEDDYCGRPRTPPLEPGALEKSLGNCPLLHWPLHE